MSWKTMTLAVASAVAVLAPLTTTAAAAAAPAIANTTTTIGDMAAHAGIASATAGSPIDEVKVERFDMYFPDPNPLWCEKDTWSDNQVGYTCHRVNSVLDGTAPVRITLPPDPTGGHFTTSVSSDPEVNVTAFTANGSHELYKGLNQKNPTIDCASYNATHAMNEGCRIELRNPFPVVPPIKIAFSVTYHPRTDNLTCPAPPKAQVASTTPDPASAPTQVGDPWEDQWEGPCNLEEAHALVMEAGSDLMACNYRDDIFYILRPTVFGYVDSPPRDRFTIVRFERKFDGLQVRTIDAHGEVLLAVDVNPLLNIETIVLSDHQRLWITRWGRDHVESGSDAIADRTVARHTVQWFEGCDSAEATCVYEINGGPDQNGVIPLKAYFLPEDHPSTPITAPTTKTKHLVVTAPPHSPNLVSVTVTTHDTNTTHTKRIPAGQMFRIPDDQTLDTVTNNTH